MDETGAASAVAIETIEAGDLVWSRCDQTGEDGFKVVVETYLREADELVHLSYRTSSGTDTLVGTAEHPFWSLTAGAWVDMGDLKVGERLSLTSGTATVTATRTELLSEPVKVYNFQVADWHTYYAAPEADKPFVWVHNANYTIGTIDPKKVRFSQDSVSATFKDGRSVGDLRKALVAGTTTAKDVEPIRLFMRKGDFFTLDNRRLLAFQQAGVDVRYRMATQKELARELEHKFTTTNNGASIRVRGRR